jgi:hypothetical protein
MAVEEEMEVCRRGDTELCDIVANCEDSIFNSISAVS